MKGGQRLSQIEHWVRILDATYKPDDRFKREMMVPLLDLMEACVQAGKKEQAIAAGRRILEIEPRIPPGATVLTMMTIARLYFETRRTDRAREELRTMRDYWWKRAGITLSQLKVVARQAMEEGDPSRVLTEILRDVDEEASPAASYTVLSPL
jgi:hypothetical protein